jgi:hypothetical protein
MVNAVAISGVSCRVQTFRPNISKSLTHAVTSEELSYMNMNSHGEDTRSYEYIKY